MNKAKQINNLASFLFHEPEPYSTCWNEDCEELAEALYAADYRHISDFLQMVENICKYEYSLSFDKIKEGVLRQMKGASYERKS